MTADRSRSVRLTVDNVMEAQEVANLLHVSTRTVYDWARCGRIPSFSIGRRVIFLRDDLEQWVLEQRKGPPPRVRDT